MTGTVTELHEQFVALSSLTTSPQLPLGDFINIGDDIADGIPIRIYKPKDAATTKLPIAVYYHGGGYMLGNLDTEDSWCRYLAKITPCIVVSVDYRLAPEFKMPTMLNDSLAAYKWVYRPPYPIVSFILIQGSYRYTTMPRVLIVVEVRF